MGAGCLCQLHMQLAGHAQAQDNNGFVKRWFGQPLGVEACRHHLKESRGSIVDRIRQAEDVARMSGTIFRDAAIHIATGEHTVWA